MTDEAKFLKKHIRIGDIDVHPTEKALVITYNIEATILDESGDPMVGEKKECLKIIRLKDLDEHTDVSSLAKEVIEKCNKLISPSKLSEVEQLLYYLQRRRDTDFAGKKPNRPAGTTNGVTPVDFSDIGSDVTERANFQKLDEYIELLYEDVPEKVRGTSMILQLARSADNLEELQQNETLLGALARVLREDWKKNIDLSTNLLYIFYCFSTFAQFHAMISHFKIGALCMQIIEFELKRYDMWKEDLKQKKNEKQQQDFDKNLRKFQVLSQKQDQLLRVALYLLYNLAEDKNTEMKMVSRGIVDLLCHTLDRRDSHPDLIVITLIFLRKLSVYLENKSSMAKQSIVERTSKLLPTDNEDLANAAIRFLFNLSFDTELRKKISVAGILPYLISMIDKTAVRKPVASLLYHISMDDESKALFTYTDCIPLCMKLFFEALPQQPPLEIMALLINLALSKRNAQLIVGDDGAGLKLLMEAAFERQDLLLLKLIRNIASHPGMTRHLLINYIGDLAQAVRSFEREKRDFALEALKVLGEMALPELDYAAILTEYDLNSWLSAKLKPVGNDDDLILEAVVYLGTVSLDVNGAMLLLESGIVDDLIKLISAKQDDDEIVLQIVFVFYQMIFHEKVRQRLLKETQAPAYLIELMHDKNAQIRKLCENTLEVIAEYGEEWGKKIQEEKFRWYNAQWLEMMGQNPEDADEEDYLQQNGDLFENSDIFNDFYGNGSDENGDRFGEENELERRPKSRIGNRDSI